MHRLILACAALLVTLPALAEDLFPPSHSAVQHYWAEACAIITIKCDMPAPSVLFGQTGRALGYYHFGSGVVVVTEECMSRVADSVKCGGVLVHEMIHYILDASNTVGPENACESERIAWEVYNLYVLNKNRRDLVNEDWTRGYPQCVSPTSTP